MSSSVFFCPDHLSYWRASERHQHLLCSRNISSLEAPSFLRLLMTERVNEALGRLTVLSRDSEELRVLAARLAARRNGIVNQLQTVLPDDQVSAALLQEIREFCAACNTKAALVCMLFASSL